MIKTVDDLETAGVLASLGHLNSLEEIQIRDIDVSGVPVNIVSSLAKIVRKEIRLSFINGICVSMLDRIKCEKLNLSNVTILPMSQEISIITNTAYLWSLSGKVYRFRSKFGTSRCTKNPRAVSKATCPDMKLFSKHKTG